MGQGNYYDRLEVSNSDLSWLNNQLNPRDLPDPTNNYRMGSLLDAMITEQHRVDFYTLCLDGAQCTRQEFDTAERMKRAFERDPFCMELLKISETQKEMAKRLKLNHQGQEFFIKMRCKWDLWMEVLSQGADIKTTTAESQSQFEAAVKYFQYDRQRAVYMTIADSQADTLIGISKVNFRIFKVHINRSSKLYQEGMAKFLDLAFRWSLYFGEDKSALKKT